MGLGQSHHKYDVIEYEFLYLPTRPILTKKTLLVARSILLNHHLLHTTFPTEFSIKKIAFKILKYPLQQKDLRKVLNQANKTLHSADLINVANNDDKSMLISYGFSSQKIIVQQYGLHKERQVSLSNTHNNWLEDKIITFIGTFDYRKGCIDIANCFKLIKESHPEVKLRLIGVKGMFQTQEAIYRFFHQSIQESVEIILRFDPGELERYISDSYMAIFPSYLESFGFSVLEQMAARIPVVSYNCPGPGSINIKECLIEVGDSKSFAKRCLEILSNENLRKQLGEKSYHKSLQFFWPDTVKGTLQLYEEMIS